jgi:hypothetical protein
MQEMPRELGDRSFDIFQVKLSRRLKILDSAALE